MQIELLKVSGMTCGGCISNVTRALKSVPGVGDVNVSLSTGEATVKYDEHLTSPAKLQLAETEGGYGVTAPSEHSGQQSKRGCCA